MALGRKVWLGVMALFVAVGVSMPAVAQQQQKPNIVFIMGDDIGWSNIGVYNQGVMAGRTPNLDRLASQGMRFHRLLRGGELHRWSSELHHRRTTDPHRDDHRWSSWISGRHTERGVDYRFRT